MTATATAPPEVAGLIAEAEQLLRQRDAAAALALLQRAQALQPGNLLALWHQAVARRDLGDMPGALADARLLVARAKPASKADVLLGSLCIHAGHYEEALSWLDRALRRDPADATARLNRGIALLSLGEIAAGLDDYEARWDGAMAGMYLRGPAETRLRRGENLAGRRVLLHWEQGFGDTLQFCRYAPILAAQGAEVTLVVRPPQQALLQHSLGRCGIRVLADGTRLPACDRHGLMISAMLACGTTLATIPGNVPYLFADAVAVARWRRRLRALAPLSRLAVGFAWAGHAEHSNDRNRSIPLAAMLPLMAMPGLLAVSLQRELRPGDAALLTALPQLPRPIETMEDFAETAALVAALDLVVTVDTAIAHLAGALGVPCCILLPLRADWRWLQDRADTPWYPAARLFRQRRGGDWTPVLRELQAHLGARLQAP